LAEKVKTSRCSKIIYDWQSKYDISQLDIQETYKLSVIEINDMYREGLEESPWSDGEYDYILGLIEDEEFKSATGTGIGEGFVPKYLRT
jgi:hypothetical protein